MLVVRRLGKEVVMNELQDDLLPEMVLTMDDEGIVRIHGWPDGGVNVSRGTMERFLTFLVSCDVLSLGKEGLEGPHGDETDEDDLT